LFHRFALQAAQQQVGGQYQYPSVAGDGQPPLRWVDPAVEKRALDLLLAALKPEELDLPDTALAALVPESNQTGPSADAFPSEAPACARRWPRVIRPTWPPRPTSAWPSATSRSSSTIPRRAGGNRIT